MFKKIFFLEKSMSEKNISEEFRNNEKQFTNILKFIQKINSGNE